MKNKGFTLVEIMIVVAIIALLAAIAIPNLLRARITANNAAAQSTCRTISTACETFAAANAGVYPATVTSLTGVTPPYLNTNLCAGTHSGYIFACTMTAGGYQVIGTAANTNSGDQTYTITTGGVFQ